MTVINLTDAQYKLHQDTEATVLTPLACAGDDCDYAVNGLDDLEGFILADDRARAEMLLADLESKLARVRAFLSGVKDVDMAVDLQDDPNAWAFE